MTPAGLRPAVAVALVAGAALLACGRVRLETVEPPPVVVAISPSAATLQVGQAQQFTATVSGPTSDRSVTWSVQEGSPAGGTITGSGLYAAPAAAGSYHVVATSRADPSIGAVAPVAVTASTPGTADIWTASLGVGLVDGGPRAGTWDLDPAGHLDTLIVGQAPNPGDLPAERIDLFFGPVGGPLATASIPIATPGGVWQTTTIMDTQDHKLHTLSASPGFYAMVYTRSRVDRGADGRITGFTKEAELTISNFSGGSYGHALAEVIDGQGRHRLAGLITLDHYTGSTTDVLGFVTSAAGGVAPTDASQFTGFDGTATLGTLTSFEHTGGPGALDGAYGCMGSIVQQPTTGTIYVFVAVGLHGTSTPVHRIIPISLAAAGAAAWVPGAAVNYSGTGTGSNYAVALPSGHVYWSWEDGVDSRISRINPDGSLNLAPLPAIGFRAEYDPGACHVAVQGDRVMTILHEWGIRARVYLATGVDHDAAGTAAVSWTHTELVDPTTDHYPLNATGLDGLGFAGGHWWSAALSANYDSYSSPSWLIVAPFP